MLPSPSLQTDEAEVLAANQAFYEALANLNIARMTALWWQEDWVSCLHPGWELLMGWDEVLESWQNIFRSTTQMRVVVTRPIVRVQGDVAWVSCVESVTSTYETGFETAMVEATNILVRRSGEWRMAHHHSTLLPDRVPTGTSRRVQ
jgi:ketosteroid isomerase-like protein